MDVLMVATYLFALYRRLPTMATSTRRTPPQCRPMPLQVHLRERLRGLGRLGLWYATLSAVLLSAQYVFTIPDEPAERNLCTHFPRWCVPLHVDRWYHVHRTFVLTQWLLEGELNQASGRPNSLFSRNLVIRNLNLAEEARRRALQPNFRDRDLRYADFSGSNLEGADFTASDLHGASLKKTSLRKAIFSCASTGDESYDQYAELDPLFSYICPLIERGKRCTNLSSTDLSQADLRETRLHTPLLVGVDLSESSLQNLFNF